MQSLLEDRDQYLARSPLLHAEKIHDPVAIFHGENDRVVSIEQTSCLVEKLNHQATPHIYQTYAGEGHGFRKPETIRDYYQRVENFLLTYLK